MTRTYDADDLWLRAVGIYEQDRVWATERTTLHIEDMRPAHRTNVLRYLIKNHRRIVERYAQALRAQVDAAWDPDLSDGAANAVNSMENNTEQRIAEILADTRQWLIGTPLFRKMYELVPERSRPTELGCLRHACEICKHEHCGDCPECSPGVPEWTTG